MSTRTKVEKKPVGEKPYWALVLVYTPFVMGGNVWQPKRYRTEGKPEKVGKYECFSFWNELQSRYQVHDVKSGGLLGDGPTLAAALEIAAKNVRTTPDLDEQMKKINLMNLDTVERAWALEACSK
jgi:hypothetical protein